MGLSLLEIIIYAALAVIAVFAIVMLIISAVFAKRHRDLDVDPLAGYSVEAQPAPAAASANAVQSVAAAAPARPYYPVPALTDDREEPDRSQPETYSDQTSPRKIPSPPTPVLSTKDRATGTTMTANTSAIITTRWKAAISRATLPFMCRRLIFPHLLPPS